MIDDSARPHSDATAPTDTPTFDSAFAAHLSDLYGSEADRPLLYNVLNSALTADERFTALGHESPMIRASAVLAVQDMTDDEMYAVLKNENERKFPAVAVMNALALRPFPAKPYGVITGLMTKNPDVRAHVAAYVILWGEPAGMSLQAFLSPQERSDAYNIASAIVIGSDTHGAEFDEHIRAIFVEHHATERAKSLGVPVEKYLADFGQQLKDHADIHHNVGGIHVDEIELERFDLEQGRDPQQAERPLSDDGSEGDDYAAILDDLARSGRIYPLAGLLSSNAIEGDSLRVALEHPNEVVRGVTLMVAKQVTLEDLVDALVDGPKSTRRAGQIDSRIAALMRGTPLPSDVLRQAVSENNSEVRVMVAVHALLWADSETATLDVLSSLALDELADAYSTASDYLASAGFSRLYGEEILRAMGTDRMSLMPTKAAVALADEYAKAANHVRQIIEHA